mgnify:CR=1 FL=1
MNDNIDRNNLKEKLSKYKEKYPNIVNVWEKVIRKKEDDLKNTFNECNNMINNIESLDSDLPMKTIISLYLLKIYST